MKARGVVGKRIVRIEQERTYDQFGILYMNILAIHLEDGTTMWPVVGELDGDYAVDLQVSRAGRRRYSIAHTCDHGRSNSSCGES